MPSGSTPTPSPDLSRIMESDGFALVPGLLDAGTLGRIEASLASVSATAGVQSRSREVYAIRNLLSLVPPIRTLALSTPVITFIRAILGPGARPVRGLLFDKNPAANWLVPWHQDLTICVKEKRGTPGFGPWSIKAGLVHVQPPVDVLQRMVAIRIHLDPATPASGALRVLPGTHRLGRLNAASIADCQRDLPEVPCIASPGDALFMKPLLLHASSAATRPDRRRVIHIEYAAGALPGDLEWFEEV